MPDVGGAFFLPRLPGALGAFLGLTGHRIKVPNTQYTVRRLKTEAKAKVVLLFGGQYVFNSLPRYLAIVH